MNRGSFIRNIVTLGLGAKIPAGFRNYKKIYLLECFVAGFQFYSGPERLEQMKEGDLLELRREPDNEADSRAIAVYHNLHKIGFIPARDNKTLSRLIDADVIPLVAEITHLEQTAARWENVRIAVSLLKEQRGPLPNHAVYLMQLNEPNYKTLNKGNKPKDWYAILEKESKTDHFYSLWYSNGPYPDMPAPTHNNDFIVIRKSRMPAYFRDQYQNHVAVPHIDIDPPYGAKDYIVMKTGFLGNYLEAARRIEEVYDNKGDNYLELHFV
ncbi:MAG: HIRAN domain-containing protein [Taibaiella sp.]|nr:HIRAN domain-containing protein [Taibaiella sp.]